MTSIFQHKTVLITGASSGIGMALAKQIAPLCQKLILVGRNEQALAALASELHPTCEHCEIWVMDVLQPEFIDRLQTQTIDVLINNAGISMRGKVVDTHQTVSQQMMDVNYFAVVNATNALLPSMIANQAGRIITIASMAGKMGSPMRAAYAASKHAIIGFMDCLRSEVLTHNIHIQVINPSFVRTNLSNAALAADGSTYGKTDKEIANGMSTTDFARLAVAKLEAGVEEINIATGKAKWGDWLHRLNPNWYHKAVRKFYKRHI